MHLSDYMVRENLSDEAMARKLKVSRVTVSRIRRRVVRPDWETIKRLKAASGGACTADDFIELGKGNGRASSRAA